MWMYATKNEWKRRITWEAALTFLWISLHKLLDPINQRFAQIVMCTRARTQYTTLCAFLSKPCTVFHRNEWNKNARKGSMLINVSYSNKVMCYFYLKTFCFLGTSIDAAHFSMALVSPDACYKSSSAWYARIHFVRTRTYKPTKWMRSFYLGKNLNVQIFRVKHITPSERWNKQKKLCIHRIDSINSNNKSKNNFNGESIKWVMFHGWRQPTAAQTQTLAITTNPSVAYPMLPSIHLNCLLCGLLPCKMFTRFRHRISWFSVSVLISCCFIDIRHFWHIPLHGVKFIVHLFSRLSTPSSQLPAATRFFRCHSKWI